MSNSKKLPPLKFDEEVKQYDALSEKKDVKFDRCKHKKVRMVGERLECPCGAVWTGTRLGELFDLLIKRK